MKVNWIVFPASAGVILTALTVPCTESGFPRIRGGDPEQALVVGHFSWFSPHPRG